MADAKVKISAKRTIQQVLEESANVSRKLSFKGPDPIRPDSRYQIAEIAADHVVFQLLGDDLLVVPYASISSLRVQPTALTVNYR